jgi:subfamily B ATP-binding cassette protein MsbA
MIYLAPLLTLIVATVFPLLAVIIGFVNKRFRKYSKRLHRAVGGVGSIAEESVHAHQILKAFGQAERERYRFERVNEQNRRQSMKLLAVKHAVVPVTRLIAGIALAGVIYLATMDALLETISVGTFASFAGAVMLLNPPLKSLITVNASIQRGLTAASSVCQVIDLPAESDTGRLSVDCAQGCIEMEGLSFSYDGHSQVLRGIDLRAEPGERVALVGPSGGGKSSLVALIPRFYEPIAGEIRLDGVPVQEFRLADLRRQISMVGQNVALFNATVAENIAFGASSEVSQEQVERAANAAYAREFIEQLPQGFDTYIGQDGVLLSGGQRQRIAIARALLKDAPVLILDEATSALDTESEANIQQALDRLMVGRTTLVIAHRLSTIENADQIIFMEDGMIKERGTHSELLQSNGRYSDLYRLQFEE